jgi:hypothetical protein
MHNLNFKFCYWKVFFLEREREWKMGKDLCSGRIFVKWKLRKNLKDFFFFFLSGMFSL